MTEKNGIANFLDGLVGGLNKMKEANATKEASSGGGETEADLVNILPKPAKQVIGENGVITWGWNGRFANVEGILNIAKDEYVVTVELPKINGTKYHLSDETARELGQTLLSAYNWKNIWKLHVGDYIVSDFKEGTPSEIEPVKEPKEYPVREPEYFGPNCGEEVLKDTEVVESIDEYDLKNVQG